MKLGLTGGIGCGKSTAGIFLEQTGWLRVDSDQLVRTLLDSDAQVHAALLARFGEKALTAAEHTATPPAKATPSSLTENAGKTPQAAARLGVKSGGTHLSGNTPQAGTIAQAAAPAPAINAPIAPTDAVTGNAMAAIPAATTGQSPASDAPSAGSPSAASPAPAMRADRRFLAQRIFSNPADKVWLENLLHPPVRRQWETQLAAAGDRPILIEIPLLFEKNLEKHFDLTVCVEADRSVQLSRLQSRGMSFADAEARIASQMPLADKVARADKILSNNGSTDFLRAQTRYLGRELLA